MKTLLNRVILLVVACMMASSTMVSAETMYILSGKCCVPLAKEMKGAKYNITKYDGANFTVTTDISCDVTGASSFYYNSLSLAYTDISNISNFGTSSSSNRTMQGLKLESGKKMTVTLNSVKVSKILVIGVCASNEKCSIDIEGEEVSTSNKNVFKKEIEGSFANTIVITNKSAKEYRLFIFLIEGSGSSTPIAVAGVSLNKTELTLEEGKSEKLIPTVDPRGATNTKVTWTSSNPSVATVDEQGNVTAVTVGKTTITVKTDDGGFTATCAVTVTASTTPVVHVEGIAFAKSHTELTLYVNDTQQLQYSITPSDATNKAVTWSVNDPSVVSVSKGLVTALKKGDATVTVTTVDGGKTAESIIHVKEKEVPVPSTDLKLHETEVYESPKGYDTELTQFNGRDYEVYYINRDASGKKLTIATSNEDKKGSISDDVNATDKTTTTFDGWATITSNGTGGDDNATAKDEFKTSLRCVKMSSTNHKLELHIKGYDQFSFYGKDNNTTISKGRYFEVYIDNVKQNTAPIADYAIHRYNISTDEHIIRVVGISDKEGNNESKLCSFSLRVAYVPKVKHISGNDSTQNILQTQAMQPVTYYLKNKVSDAEFSWDGAEATGISMQKGANDTLTVSGTANCKNGVYKYTISAKDKDGKVISTKTGTITVSSKVAYQRMIDSVKTVYEKAPIEPMLFNYYSIDQSDLSWRWTSQTPAGLSFTVDESAHTLTLSGTPTTVGTFPYEVTLKDANTLKGKITVLSNSPTVVPGASKTMLYLYKTERTNDIYSDLTRKYNYFARPAGGAGKDDSDYSDYDFIVISEDADANNDEVINIIKNVKKPVLNMKNFTYTTSRLGWGYPDNGSVNNTEITVLQPQHPVFKDMNVEEGSKIKLLSQVTGRGLMPSEITLQGSYALATALKQGAQYEADGEPETFLHEVPQATRGAKYILFPLSEQSAGNLTSDGRKLLQNVIEYLLSTEESKVVLPELKITSFSIDGHQAQIDEAQQEIHLELPEGTDLTQLTPQITLANHKTKVTPASGTTLNMSDSYFGVDFTVSDFINRKVYTAYITTATSLDDLSAEGLWYDGKVLHNPQGIWVNIYNVQGMLITTTNADYSFESQPQSMYMIVSERGVMKVMN